jgi:hypothetical protein
LDALDRYDPYELGFQNDLEGIERRCREIRSLYDVNGRRIAPWPDAE